MNRLSLDHLTVQEATPPELIDIAAATGCVATAMWFNVPPFGLDAYPMIGDTAMRRETAARISATGVRIHAVGIFALLPEMDWERFRGMMESGAILGAKRAICLGFDPDAGRALENFCRLCLLAAEFGMSVDAEFIAFSALNSLDAALKLLSDARQANAGLILDPLHLMRSGGKPADLARVPPSLVGYAQLCDGPATMAADRQMHEGSEQRQLPGEGGFPLREFVSALPGEVLIGVEIPLRDRIERGMGPLARARLAVDTSRRIIEATGGMR